MCDHSTGMPGGDSGPEGEEDPVLSSTTGDAREGSMSSCQRDGGVEAEHLRVEESRSSGGEAGQEDEEMTSGSHDLSSSADHSPSSALGSPSSSAKRLAVI